jgi:hypothetical protein
MDQREDNGPKLRKRSALFLLIDALRYDTMADPVARKFMFPNLAKIVDRGFVQRVVTNAQSTQFVMPSLFSLTYPLDHGGYDTGIRKRPSSYVEVLKSAGWTTHKLVTVNQLGVHNGYDRGFDTVRTGTDFRVVLEHNLDRTLSHQIDLWKSGEKSEADVIEVFQVEFRLVLDQLEKNWNHFDHSLWPRRLKKINGRVAKGLVAERKLLAEDPLVVLKKVANLSGAAYWQFLGARRYSRIKRFLLHSIGYVHHRTRKWMKGIDFLPYFFMSHFPLVLPDVVSQLCDFAEEVRGQRWFAYMHFMDAHDSRILNRGFRVMARWRFLPKWWIGRMRGYTSRRFPYDTALMVADVCVGKFFAALEKSGELEDLLIVITGDHAQCYAGGPERESTSLERRNHYEDIEVPMILVGGKPPPDDAGLIDSMGVTATFLDVLGVEGHPSFKGVSLYSGGKEAIITESCGSGAADLVRKDIYFTVTTKSHRMMTKLSGTEFSAFGVYDIKADPKELNNLIEHPESKPVIASLMDHIRHERAELFTLRGMEIDVSASLVQTTPAP